MCCKKGVILILIKKKLYHFLEFSWVNELEIVSEDMCFSHTEFLINFVLLLLFYREKKIAKN